MPENGIMRFSVAEIKSRVSYGGEFGEKSTFEVGDSVGALIYIGNQWSMDESKCLASLWVVNKNKILELKQIKNLAGSPSAEFVDIDANNNDLICRYNQYNPSSKVGDEYLWLKMYSPNEWEQKTYVFCFYYPFVSCNTLNNEYAYACSQFESAANKNADGSYMKPFHHFYGYPNNSRHTGVDYGKFGNGHLNHFKTIYENDNTQRSIQFALYRGYSAEIAGRDEETASEAWQYYSYANYPIFVSANQITSRQVQLSDFMYVRCMTDNNGQPITQTNPNTTINLEFKKKFATIEIISELPLENLYYYRSKEVLDHFQQTDGRWNDGIIMGKSFSLQSDYMQDWNRDGKGDLIMRNYVTKFPCEIYPWEIVPQKRFRVVLPPQELKASLHFEYEGEEKDFTLNDLMKGIYQLEENKIYIIRFNKNFDFLLEIRDWIDGGDNELEEIAKTQN